MGLFDFFKKENSEYTNTDNGVQGPTYLEKFSEHILNPKKLLSHEWRRTISNNENKKFRIKYYGQLHNIYENLIVETEFSKPLIFAVDVTNNQEILLWDGCRHGYNPIFCDTFSKEQIENRKAEIFYKDKFGNDTFEIIISTYNQCDFEEEMKDGVGEDGFFELYNGQRISLEEAKRNGFDCLGIYIINQNGRTTEIVSEELA